MTEPAPTRRERRVLIVDDDDDNREALGLALQSRGHAVQTAASGRAALESIRNGSRYDCVICDIAMPDTSGWQVAAELRRMVPEVRICLLTGWAREIAPNDSRRHLVDAVLAKPIDLDRIEAAILGG